MLTSHVRSFGGPRFPTLAPHRRVASPALRQIGVSREIPVVQANPEVERMYDMTEEQLLNEAFDLKQTLFELRIKRAVGETVQTHLFRRHRKRIAQLLTVKRKKEIERGISKRESRKIEKNNLLKAGALVR